MKPLRVILDARIESGRVGGVETVIIGLATGLSGLADEKEEYLFLSYADSNEWLLPHLSGRAGLLEIPRPEARRGWRRAARMGAPPIAKAWDRLRDARPNVIPPPRSDGAIERAGADVMHFTFQAGFITGVPSIYHPHDLQHLHFPEFFTRRQRAHRELWYRRLCAQAAMVAVSSSWTRNDVIHWYGLDPSKVVVVPLAPGVPPPRNDASRPTRSVRDAYRLPDRFALYPAATWPHKNHAALLQAMSILRHRDDLSIALVAPGMETQHTDELRAIARGAGVSDLVSFLGFIPAEDLHALFQLAHVVVVPSLFESASAPMWEAFQSGIPTACSNVTSLPCQAGDAALLFDPEDPEDIARALRRIWHDDTLRDQLAAAGHARVSTLTWDRTARLFRAHYRRLAGRPIGEDDSALLKSPPGI